MDFWRNPDDPDYPEDPDLKAEIAVIDEFLTHADQVAIAGKIRKDEPKSSDGLVRLMLSHKAEEVGGFIQQGDYARWLVLGVDEINGYRFGLAHDTSVIPLSGSTRQVMDPDEFCDEVRELYENDQAQGYPVDPDERVLVEAWLQVSPYQMQQRVEDLMEWVTDTLREFLFSFALESGDPGKALAKATTERWADSVKEWQTKIKKAA